MAGHPEHPEGGDVNVDTGDKAVSGGGVISLGDSLSVGSAEELRASLSAALVAGQPFVLDGGAVERADIAGLQVLAAFFAAPGARALCRWGSTSEPLWAVAELCGLVRQIGLGDGGRAAGRD